MNTYLIPIETKVRDFHSRLLISMYLLKKSKDKIYIYFGDRRKMEIFIKIEN